MTQALHNPFADYLEFLTLEPESDEPELESDFHREQIDLLIRLLKHFWRDREDIYVAGNLTVYYSPTQKTTEDFRGPDFFVALGAQKRDRKSWVVWNEAGQYPNLIIELLSPSTAKVDRTLKKELYQNIWRVPEYFWFDPTTREFRGFSLQRNQYEPIAPNEQGWLWSAQLELFFGLHGRKLRCFDAQGYLVPLPEETEAVRANLEAERADLEAQRANQATERANQEAERANQEAERANQATERAHEEAERARQAQISLEALQQRLRDQGIDPDRV